MPYSATDILRDFPDHQIPPKTLDILADFIKNYQEGICNSARDQTEAKKLLKTYTSLICNQFTSPYEFELFHRSVRSPFDYYQFGLDFIRLIIDFNKSQAFGLNYVDQIESQLSHGDNVILLANHQIEADPQVISLLIESTHPKLATEMIFVAGHRVTSDPLAVPFSIGRNLLCIYSKKHIDHPIDAKHQKMLHNQRTLKKMEDLLNEGGHCIYVAPSGGRDRPNEHNIVEVAPFDPQNIELFCLISKQSSCNTHFYPLAINSFHLLPPPSKIQKELGEQRLVKSGPAYIAFGPELHMDNFPVSNDLLKKERRQLRANYAWQMVRDSYANLI